MRFLFIVKSTFFLSLLLSLASCASWQEGWTAEYQAQFREACLSGDGRLHPDPDAYCDCVLQKTIERYPTIALFMEQKDSTGYREDLRQCP